MGSDKMLTDDADRQFQGAADTP